MIGLVLSIVLVFKFGSFGPFSDFVGWGEKNIAIDNSGKHIAFATVEGIFVISDKGQKEAHLEIRAPVTVDWIPQKDALLFGVGRSDGIVGIWYWRRSKDFEVIGEHGSAVNSVDWNKKRRLIASASDDGTVSIWRLKNKELVKSFDFKISINAIAWSPDGQFLACGGTNGELFIINSSWKVKRKFLLNSSIYSVAWSPDGTRIAVSTGWPDKAIVIYDILTDSLTFLTHVHSDAIWSIEWADDGFLLASASKDGSIIIWNTYNWLPIKRFTCDTSWYKSVVWDEDGNVIASRWDGKIDIFEVQDFDLVVEPSLSPKSQTGSPKDTIPPEIKVLYPDAEGKRSVVFEIDEKTGKLKVIGLVRDVSDVPFVLVNSTEADVSRINGGVKFIAQVPVHEGVNEITITAVDASGNVSRKEFKVETRSRWRGRQLAKLPKIWAIVVGISNYKNRQLRLKYAATDARSFVDILTGPNMGVPNDRIVLLTDKRATRANILKAMMDVVKMAGENDLIIVYMALHGVPAFGKLYFLPYEGDEENIVGTGISRNEILDIFNYSYPEKRVLFIFDACHAGAFDWITQYYGHRGTSQTFAFEINRLLEEIANSRKGVSVFASTSVYDLSFEDEKLKHGVFTYYLIKGLEGKADIDRDGIVRLGELASYVRENVIRRTKGNQVPQMRGDRELPLSVVR